jgi:hypothetical protein
MVVSAWHMLSTGETYRELGADYFTRRHDPQRQLAASPINSSSSATP